MTESKPLVWLPFAPDLLGSRPESLRYEVFLPEEGVAPPPEIRDVEFYVPPFGFSARVGSVLEQMPSLRVVQSMSAGVDHLRSFVRPEVTLCRGAGVHDASTAELTLALILASLRALPDFVRAQDRAEWSPRWTTSLADRTVLIVGYGSVGSAIERRLEGFEVEVIRVARTAREGVSAFADLPSLLPRADVVILIVPITDETRGLADAAFLSRMKQGALLVNMARGPVVDTAALVSELEKGRIHAALDVTDPEPLPTHDPLWSAPNLLLSPHVGGASSAMWPRVYAALGAQLERYAAGAPLEHVVTGAY
ncbi:MAG TPA: 2-hydroxyacid dehydrogenase [Dermatophilaceae bacterium]|nr:2-hydroxyacid dehydrogenase [Dermatophilaceae bacterium]